MNKKFTAVLLSLMLTLTVVLAGCAKKEEPKAAMQTAAQNAMKMTSYEMKSSFVIEDLQVQMAETEGDPTVDQAMTMLKNAELTVNGVHQAEPQQTEVQMGISLKGDMGMNINLDMVMTKEMMYIKVPNIPILPFPESVQGKYLAMDLKELAEQAGEDFSLDSMDTEKSQKFSGEVMDAVISEFDEAKYFKQVESKDANLPEGVDAKQVVQFYITNENVNEAIETLVKKVAPKVVDIAAKEEYRELLGVTQEDIDQLKTEVNSIDDAEFQEDLAEIKDYLTVNNFAMNTAIDKKDFPVYQDFVFSADFKDPDTDDNIKMSFKGSTQYSKINEKQTFNVGIPAEGDTITMEEFENAMYESGLY